MQCYPKNKVLNNRYRITAPLGEGAMSFVYLAEDLQLAGASWAVKQLNLNSIKESEKASAKALFEREKEVLEKLHHPGMPSFVDYFVDKDGDLYIVMECVKGQTLEQILSGRLQPLKLAEALPIALQVLHVLDYLHSQDPPVIFRDLKPSNIMLQPTGRVRFIDFGIARYYHPQSAKDTQELGTPGYCAPEQYHGCSTPRSDIYAWGVTLFYLLSLKEPQEYNLAFPPLSSLITVPESLSTLVSQCTDLDPNKRPASASECLQKLEAIFYDNKLDSNRSTQTLSPALTALSKHLANQPQTSTRSRLKELGRWLLGAYWRGND